MTLHAAADARHAGRQVQGHLRVAQDVHQPQRVRPPRREHLARRQLPHLVLLHLAPLGHRRHEAVVDVVQQALRHGLLLVGGGAPGLVHVLEPPALLHVHGDAHALQHLRQHRPHRQHADRPHERVRHRDDAVRRRAHVVRPRRARAADVGDHGLDLGDAPHRAVDLRRRRGLPARRVDVQHQRPQAAVPPDRLQQRHVLAGAHRPADDPEQLHHGDPSSLRQ